MRIETVEIKVYKFEELTGKAKETAKEKLREWMRDNDVFYEDLMIRLNEIFPNSEMQVQYSLSSCQGDGLNVYGKVSIVDIVNYALYGNDGDDKSSLFTKQEMRFLKFLTKQNYFDIKFPQNWHYCYYTDKAGFVSDEIEYELENQYFRGILYDTIHKLAELFDERIEKLCKQWENEGYSYFYEYSDDDAKEDAENNGYEFTVDGKIY